MRKHFWWTDQMTKYSIYSQAPQNNSRGMLRTNWVWFGQILQSSPTAMRINLVSNDPHKRSSKSRCTLLTTWGWRIRSRCLALDMAPPTPHWVAECGTWKFSTTTKACWTWQHEKVNMHMCHNDKRRSQWTWDEKCVRLAHENSPRWPQT